MREDPGKAEPSADLVHSALLHLASRTTQFYMAPPSLMETSIVSADPNLKMWRYLICIA